jgi:hypothetical protein
MAEERTAPDVQRMGLQAEKIWREAERRIMEDVIRRIKKAGEITSTADYQINRLIEMGKSREEVERIIKEALGATWPEMFEMYDKVAEWEYVRNREIYEQVNDDFLTPEDNKWLRQITEAARKQTKDTLVNMAQSYGFSVLMAGKRVFTPFAEYYQKYVDTAIQDVVTGGTDYNSAIRKVVTQMTNSGLRVVDYASGHTNRADVAARRAVITGVNQITAQVSEHNAEKLDTEYFEVSWHPCARPDHQTWQGRVFSKKELGTVCGYGTVTGLCGANCRHTFHPFIPGVSERLYPDDWLEEQNKREAQTKEWNGKQLNAYEQTQQQRKMETAMRAQRQKIRLLEEAGADKDDIMLEKAKYQGQLNEYKQFSKKMGLVEQRERIYQDGLGKVATNTKQQNARYTPEMIRNAKIDSNQYKRYKEVLKEDAGSLADFRQMKYNDPEKWDELQHRYSVVRLYDVDSGEMSPSKIYELDQKAFQTKTELFTGTAKRKGNIAVMEFDGVTKFGNSQLDEEGDSAYTNFKGDKTTLVLQTKSPKFKTTVVGNHDRFGDSEAKLFEYAASVAGDGKEHTLNLLSERCMCESCRGVMQQFKENFPNVKVNAVSNAKKQAEKNKNKPWAGRTR